MKTKSNKDAKNFASMSKIHWYLKVGRHYGTIRGKKQALEIVQVNRMTFHNWITGKVCAPHSALELLRLHAFGEPPSGKSTAWRGFRFCHDRLITEDGRDLSPADMKAVFFWKQMALNNLKIQERREMYQELRKIYAVK